MSAKSNAVRTLRWIAVLPAAILAAWLAWILVNILGRLSLGYAGVEPDSFLGELYFNSTGHLAIGATFVYAAAKVAPLHRKVVAYVLAALGLVISGFLLFPAIMIGSGWAIWGGVCVAVGVGAVAYAVHQGETDIE